MAEAGARRGRRWIRRGALAALLVLAGSGLALWLGLRASLPGDGPLTLDAADGGAVRVTFDAYARPTVDAPSLAAALHAEGYLHARERGWQMELLRRAGQGRLAELLGPSLLETDRELWRAGVPQLAARLAARPGDGANAALIESYVAGVNAGFASLGARPPELLLLAHRPRPWTPADVYAVGAMIAWDSANNLDNELVRLDLARVLDAGRFAAFLPAGGVVPGYPYVLPPVAPAPELALLDPLERAGLPGASLGSNGWAVAAGRSAAGVPLFAFDSHDGLSLPNLFYEVHLHFGGGRELHGWSLPGLPGVVNGYNEYVAWGLTNAGDTQDLFVLPADAPVRRSETVSIPVRGRRRPERLRIDYTDWGPVISGQPRLALSWTGHHVGHGGLDALIALNRATDPAALEAAFDAFEVPVSNVTWASRDGHIGWRTIGRLPLRGAGDGVMPLAATTDSAWQGFVAVDAMPGGVDPAAGYVAAANARVNAPGDGPLVSADTAAPYRIRRIQSVLAERVDHDLESMRALQVDWWNGQAERLLPALMPALQRRLAGGATPAERAAAVLLADWQSRPVNEPGLAAPLVFEGWYLALAGRLFAAHLGAELWSRVLRRNYLLNDALDRLLLEDADSPWWDGRRDELVAEAHAQAVQALVDAHGADPARWRWDARHAVVLRHELAQALPPLGRWLDRGPYPWGGSAATVGRAGDRYDRPGRVTHAATVRVAGEIRPDGPSLRSIMPGGQSGHPLSPHYDDQTATWLAGGLLQPMRSSPSSASTVTRSPLRTASNSPASWHSTIGIDSSNQTSASTTPETSSESACCTTSAAGPRR
jgi:penicillin amidase